MEYTVELSMLARRPLTEEALFAAAEVGGVAAGTVGARELETTLTVTAADLPAAAERAIARITELVAGEIIAVEAMTIAEADRRLAAPAPEFVGVAEVAELLGVSRQRVVQLAARDDFPTPVARLASGPVWRKGDLSTFADGWQRKAGRPRKMIAAPA